MNQKMSFHIAHLLWWVGMTLFVYVMTLQINTTIPDVLIWNFCGYLATALIHLWWQKSNHPSSWWRLVVRAFPASLLWVVFNSVLAEIFIPTRESINVEAILPAWLFMLFVSVAWAFSASALHYFQGYLLAKRQLVLVSSDAKKARLQALMAQLRPHFLFNALNTVSAKIDEDPQAAQNMLADLADLLREVLLDRPGKRRVADELHRLALYLTLEKARFEDRLQVSFDIADEIRELVMPAFLLQPLVENAVRFGMRAENIEVVRIGIEIKKSEAGIALCISNPGKLGPKRKEGLGLANVKARLAELFPKQSWIRLTEKDGRVECRLWYRVTH